MFEFDVRYMCFLKICQLIQRKQHVNLEIHSEARTSKEQTIQIICVKIGHNYVQSFHLVTCIQVICHFVARSTQYDQRKRNLSDPLNVLLHV